MCRLTTRRLMSLVSWLFYDVMFVEFLLLSYCSPSAQRSFAIFSWAAIKHCCTYGIIIAVPVFHNLDCRVNHRINAFMVLVRVIGLYKKDGIYRSSASQWKASQVVHDCGLHWLYASSYIQGTDVNRRAELCFRWARIMDQFASSSARQQSVTEHFLSIG